MSQGQEARLGGPMAAGKVLAGAGVGALGALVLALGWVGWFPAPAAFAQGTGAEAAQLRVVHLVGGMPALDVWVDGALRFEGLAARSVSRYVRLPAGEHLLRAEGPGGSPVLEETVLLQPGVPHTAVLVGSSEGGVDVILLIDEFPRAEDRDRARVRLIDALPGYEVRAALDGDGEIPLGRVYVPVAPGSYDLTVLSPEGKLLMRVQGLGFGPQRNYTLIVADLQGTGLPTTLFVVRDRPNPPVPAIIWVGLALWALLLARFVINHLP